MKSVFREAKNTDPSHQSANRPGLRRSVMGASALLLTTLTGCTTEAKPTPERTKTTITVPAVTTTETPAAPVTFNSSAAEKAAFHEQAKPLEKKYGVSLTTLEENLARHPNDSYKPTDAPQVWKPEQIVLFDEVLSKVPPNLLAARDGTAISFSISSNEDAGSCCGLYETKGHPMQAVLTPKYLNRANKEELLNHTVHELTHIRDQDFQRHGPAVDSLWNAAIDQAMGISARDLQGSDQFSHNLFSTMDDPTTDMRLLNSLAYPMWHMLDGDEWSEWISEGAENYLYGKDYFLDGYGKYLDGVTDPAVPEQFYTLLKDNVFNGTEFAEHPLVIK